MRFKAFLKLVYFRFFSNAKGPLAGRNIVYEKRFLEQLYQKNEAELKEYNNCLLRSFLQYKCQMYIISNWKRITLNLISPFLIIIFIPYALLRGCSLKQQNFDKKLAVINGDVDEDLIPVTLQEQYKTVKYRDNYKFALNFHGLKWLIRTSSKYLFYPYFIFKITVKAAQYSYIITYYRPKIIITTSEYSFCSSALTLFCENQGVQHFNIMHGEKCLDIKDSFFKFSRCFVWEDFYVNLFKTLRADMNQFVVERPPKQQKIIALGKTSKPLKNSIKFYWASECSKDELSFISTNLKRIQDLGFEVIVRYHPLQKFFFYKKVYPFLNDFEIEDPKQVSLYDSLLETEYVFGSYTTVLYEGFLMNRKLIINDFNYLALLKQNFISTNLPHSKLSEFKGCNYV